MVETDFGWALAALRAGYGVRRASWPVQLHGGRCYLHIRDHHNEDIPEGKDVEAWLLELVNGDKRTQLLSVSAEEIMAYDWEIATDAK